MGTDDVDVDDVDIDEDSPPGANALSPPNRTLVENPPCPPAFVWNPTKGAPPRLIGGLAEDGRARGKMEVPSTRGTGEGMVGRGATRRGRPPSSSPPKAPSPRPPFITPLPPPSPPPLPI